MTDKIIVVFVFLILGFLGFILFEATKTYDSPKELQITPLATEKCDLQNSPCTFEHPELGKVTFDISPRPIKMNKKLILSIATEKKTVEGWIDFLGLEMDMGFNRPKLVSNQDGSMTGTGVLPTCTQSKMTWQATVILKGVGKYFGAPFRFITVKE